MILAAALDRPRVSTVRPHVQVLERSAQLLVVRWVEPGRAHFGEQHWKPGAHGRPGSACCRARGSRAGTTCSARVGATPPNARAMILAVALDTVGLTHGG